MAFFLTPWVVLLVGWIAHSLLDRAPNRRTSHRLIELALLWVMVWFGFWGVLAGIGHIGPGSADSAASIGYAPSMFQWELGWADIGVGVLAIGCAFPKLRGTWMTAAVVMLSFMYLGDAIGHLMQYYAHDNTSPNNVWAIPSDIVQPLLAIVLLVLYRRGEKTRAPLQPADAV